MRVGVLVWLLLCFAGFAAASEAIRAQTRADVLSEIANGRGAQLLLSLETQAIRFDELARSSEAPGEYVNLAGLSYQQAAITAMFMGEWQKAVRFGESMLALAQQVSDNDLKLRAVIRLIVAYSYIRNIAKTAEYVHLGFELVHDFPENSQQRLWRETLLYHFKGTLFHDQSKYEEAVDLYQRALDSGDAYIQNLPKTEKGANSALVENWAHVQANNYLGIGGAYYRLGKYEMALASYQRGLDVFKDTKFRQRRANLLVGIGMLLRQRGDFVGALGNAQTSLDQLRREQRRAMIPHAAGLVAEILRETGKPAEAFEYYREAIGHIEFVRSSLGSRYNREWYFADWTDIYAGMISVLSSTGAHHSAFDFNERARSRSFLDLLGSKVQLARQASEITQQRQELTQMMAVSELGAAESTAMGRAAEGLSRQTAEDEQAYLALLDVVRKQDREQASLMSVEPLAVKELQALLEPKQALLEYFVTRQQTYLWVVDKQGLYSFSLRLSRAELNQKLEALRVAISERKPLMQYQTLARELYAHLIAPASSSIQGKELIIVPHDVLHNLPFHALVGSDGRFLIEKSPIQYLSSASLMQFTQAKRRALGEKVLAFGNPALGESVKELKFAEQETAELRKLFPGTTPLLRSDATKDKVKSMARDYDILHFAAHTELKQDDPLSSAVLLAKTDIDDGRLAVHDIFGLDLKASLVVLSGCETALGKLSRGDEFVGLTRAFIYAGTPSVLASLWKVDDASTAQLMSSFYKNLKIKSKVESLRQAQLDMIRGKLGTRLLVQRGVGGVGKLGQAPARASLSQISISTSHPFFWAPFILVGDGK